MLYTRHSVPHKSAITRERLQPPLGSFVKCTAQTWAKRLDNDPNWDKINRPKAQLREEHKQRSLEFLDEYPQATGNDAMDSLTEKFEGLDVKRILFW